MSEYKWEGYIYAKIPYEDINYNKNKFWLLKKALYGLKQTGRIWYNEISQYLVSFSFRKYKKLIYVSMRNITKIID